jgi:hypothetical protein
MIDDCDTKLKAEYCHRFLDAIYHGDNDLAIFLIDDLIKKGVDITCPFIERWPYSLPEHVHCSTLYYACIFNRIIIIKYLLDTSLFDDCIVSVINKLVNDRDSLVMERNKFNNVDFDPKIKYDYRHENKQFQEKRKWMTNIKKEFSGQSHDKLKRILKLLLSHLSQKRIETIQIPEPIIRTLEGDLGDDYLEEYDEEEIEAQKKALQKMNVEIKKKHDEIVDIIKNHPGSIFKEPSSDLNEFNLKKIPNPLRVGGVKKSKKSKKSKKMQTKSKKRKGKKSRKYYKK